ncbi:MAG: hypothetical protein ACKN9U_26430, partial [Pirellulaceae bacterium]
MMTESRWIRLVAWMGWVVVCAGVDPMRYQGNALWAQTFETLEAMALAPSRRDALAQLIPGTEEAFYFATLVAQAEGNFPEAEATLRAWESAFPRSTMAASLRDRQLWLEFPQKPQALIDRVIGRLQ